MTTCYFTATGNCLYVARRIGGTPLSIPQLMRKGDLEIADDAVGIVCPCYAVEMPMMVRDFLSKARIRTGYFFFIYTYGMGIAAAFAHAELAARAAGLRLRYCAAIQMVDNYLPVFEMGDQLRTLPEKRVDEHVAEVVADIAARRERPVAVTPADEAEMARYKRLLAEPILRKDTAKGYIVTDACVRCGVCAKVCPADNIRVSDAGVEFGDRCEVCYACLHNCPKNALHMREERSAMRFRNEHVTLADIVAANG